MKRKLMVATVLASEAKIIFLDEPTTGLDPLSRREFWKLLKEICQDHFIFLTTHYLEEAEELASVIGILDCGRMKGVDSLDGLRQVLKYPYSIRLESSSEAERILQERVSGEILHRGSQLRALTTEDEALALAQMFHDRHQKVWMEPVFLEDSSCISSMMERDSYEPSEPTARRDPGQRSLRDAELPDRAD